MTVDRFKKHPRHFSTSLLFQMEQWFALLVGLSSLVVSVWAILDGHDEFSIVHSAHFSTKAIVSAGWFLTVVVGFSGILLLRFAFYRPGEPEEQGTRQG